MKKALLYLLLFSYSTIVLKPVLPTISDTIAHIFWYSNHMATVHCENGQYHVHLEYTAAAKKGHPEKNNSLRADDSVNFHLSPVQHYTFTAFPPGKNKFVLFSATLPLAFQTCHYHPPKMV